MEETFAKLARQVERAVGTPWAFVLAFGIIVVWAVTGPLFGFNETWQMVINTTTTIITFLMVFLIQSTQSRDTQALHVKLDELLRVIGPARTPLVNAEDMSQAELDRLRQEMRDAADRE